MDIRNVAIIAHVDHGKTTLVDGLLRQSGSFRDNQRVAERAMDSNDQERERGITILAKCTSVTWKEARINIVDTPGHADFGGEVERILDMVDGVLLLVDAAEGPMPQTKFVLAKALSLGLRPIVVINKADRPDARVDWVHDAVFDLFVALDANDQQLEFPMLTASAKEGWASVMIGERGQNLTPIFETILTHVPAPKVTPDGPFRMLITTLEADPYLGRVLTGRIQSGSIRQNASVRAIRRDGSLVEAGRLSKLLAFRGLDRVAVDSAEAGDIVAVAGLNETTVADTLGDPSITEPITARPIDPPTLSILMGINDSPLVGRSGKKVTSRMIRTRLLREAEGNVSIRITETDGSDSFEVAGRGELQLGVLIETMRREGFEMTIGRPRVLLHKNASGASEEPMEEVQIDVDEEFSGVVLESMAERRAKMTDLRPSGGGKVRLTFQAPSRGLIGYHGDFMTETRGTGIMSRVFHGYGPHCGSVPGRRHGVLVSTTLGRSVAYALAALEDRGTMFIGNGEEIYQGMIIGENSRGGDIDVNPLKAKQLTNMRASGKDDAVRLSPHRRLTLEMAIAYIQDDERVEVTPDGLRMRKAYLDPIERKRQSRRSDVE
jgi:GTP-binding protein